MMISLLHGALVAAAVLAPAAPAPPGRQGAMPTTLTSLWRDDLADLTRARLDQLPGLNEPSDLLLYGGRLYSVSDNFGRIDRIDFDGPGGAPRRGGTWRPEGMPEDADLEALALLPGGEVLAANERNGTILVISPFPENACAAWTTGLDATCFIGRANCGIEALAVLPGGRLFVAKEREPRTAFLFDLPERPCVTAALGGRTYLRLPEEVGPDISAATYDAASGHLFVVARSKQAVLEFAVPDPTPGDTSPRPLTLLGRFSFAAAENALDYPGLDFHQVEGIAIDDRRVLYLVVDNNGRTARAFGNDHPALLRFFPIR